MEATESLVGTSWSDTTTPNYKAVVKASAGNFIQAFGMNEGAATRWLMFFDATAVPNDGATPKFAPLQVVAADYVSIAFPRARYFTQGICWAISSTNSTLTHDAAATFSLSVEYK